MLAIVVVAIGVVGMMAVAVAVIVGVLDGDDDDNVVDDDDDEMYGINRCKEGVRIWVC